MIEKEGSYKRGDAHTFHRKLNELVNTPGTDITYEVQLVPGRPLSMFCDACVNNQILT